MLRAQAAQARGAVELATGDAHAALRALRRAKGLWQELEAPYEVGQTRVLMAQACRSLGDDETATLELDAARAAFEQLGAAQDVARVDALGGATTTSDDRPTDVSRGETLVSEPPVGRMTHTAREAYHG